MEDLNEVVNELDVFDHPTEGFFFFTWCNKRDSGGRIYCKLDRALVNTERVPQFSHINIEVMAPMISDHSPIVVRLKNGINTGIKPFKFQNF